MASKKVIISKMAEEVIGKYFEDYRIYQYGNDLQIRAFNYSKMRSVLSHIDAFSNDIYSQNSKKYIDIEDFCTVEFSIENNLSEILIKNIYFKK